ncbi:hypothetical protein CYMTET_8853 [Cymbomonas tetramitiformis]|uniref:MHD domain-containing protein n=1 Tax=Cymbomonas tetramitiformis TaxID=36881 RepID=A0AAE0GSG0_9CHLO|nr:hypothetical protein CYMTET_8853 [Cymbomonas tetramitiformis]
MWIPKRIDDYLARTEGWKVCLSIAAAGGVCAGLVVAKNYLQAKQENIGEIYVNVLQKVNLSMAEDGRIIGNSIVGEVNVRAVSESACDMGLPTFELSFTVDKRLKTEENTVEVAECVSYLSVESLLKDKEEYATVGLRFTPRSSEPFQLMRYSLNEPKSVPLLLHLGTMKEECGDTLTQLAFMLNLKADFEKTAHANDVTITVPAPPIVGSCEVLLRPTSPKQCPGHAVYDPETSTVIWKIKKLNGGENVELKTVFDTNECQHVKNWKRGPILADFQIPAYMAAPFSASRLAVSDDRLVAKWIKYDTESGVYEI